MATPNYDAMSARNKAVIRRMCQIRGVELTPENLEAEARLLRWRSGWFLFDYPSTIAKCNDRKRILSIPAYEVPAPPNFDL